MFDDIINNKQEIEISVDEILNEIDKLVSNFKYDINVKTNRKYLEGQIKNYLKSLKIKGAISKYKIMFKDEKVYIDIK